MVIVFVVLGITEKMTQSGNENREQANDKKFPQELYK